MVAAQKAAIATFDRECDTSERELYSRVMARMGDMLKEELDSLKGHRAAKMEKVC